MAQHENIGVQRFEIPSGVFERLAFGQARSARGNVNHIRAEAKCREFKRCPRPRAWLDKEIYERFAAKRRHFFDLAGADLLEGAGGFENEIDFVGGELAQPKQIFSVPVHAHSLNNQTPSGSWSTFRRRT